MFVTHHVIPDALVNQTKSVYINLETTTMSR